MAQALAEPAASEARLKRLYGVETLDGFGALTGAEVAALGLIAAHLETTQAGRAAGAVGRRAAPARPTSWPSTRRPAPAWRSSARQSGAREGSLLAAIDRTVTAARRAAAGGAAGAAADVARAIDARLDAIDWLLGRRALRQKLRAALKGAGDMARALSRLALGRGGPRDLAALRDGLAIGEALVA